jgi:hypothetical protein
MASYISGKFAIGKIDCTTQPSICKDPKFNIKGYPSLKIYKDGNFFDYTSKRDADSMIEFMEKMSLPSVSMVTSYEEFMEDVLEKTSDGVAFVAYDPKGKENEVKNNKRSADVTAVEKILSSTNFLQIYGQSSRILQSTSTFALLHPKSKGEVAKFFKSTPPPSSKGPMLLRIEKDMLPIVYNNDELSSTNAIDWIKEYYMPLVTKLEGHNFRIISSLGKPLLIGVVHPEDEEDVKKKQDNEAFQQKLRHMVQNGPEEIIKKYKFTTMNGKKFHSFLKQFNISSTSTLPQAIVVNVQNRTFYQNETFPILEDFIEAVENGSIVEQKQEDSSGKGFLGMVTSWFMKYMPYSVILVVIIFSLFCWVVVRISTDDSDDRDRLVLSEEQLRQMQQLGKEKRAKSKTLKED